MTVPSQECLRPIKTLASWVVVGRDPNCLRSEEPHKHKVLAKAACQSAARGSCPSQEGFGL